MTMRDRFRSFAVRCAALMGSSYAFITGVAVIVLWGASGPFFGFSDTWQLVINTGTTVITFLMVFVIQYTQNRDTQAIHLKLDELLRAVDAARNGMISLEDSSDEKLEEIKKEFKDLAETTTTSEHS